MSKSFNVSFNILGNLDPSLLASIQNAQKSVESLGKLNGKAIQQAQKLQNAQNQLKSIQGYRDLQRAMKDAEKDRAGELLNANRLNVQQKAAQSQLDNYRESYKRLQRVQREGKAKIDTDKLSVAKLKSALAEHGKDMGKDAAKILREQIRSAESEIKAREKSLSSMMRGAASELKAQESAVKGLSDDFAAASARAKELQATLAAQKSQLSQMRTALPSGSLAAQEMQLRANIQQTTNALNREIAALERRNQIQANFSQRQQDLSNAYGNFQSSIDSAKSIMSPFKDAADNAMEFEYAMSNVKALTQMRNIKEGNTARVEEEMAALTAQAKELGGATEFTKTEVAQAQGYLGMAGWDYTKIQAGMKPILDLASIAGDHNIQRTADVFSDIMTAMSLNPGEMKNVGGKEVEASSHFADSMAYALTQSNMNRENFFEALKYSAPIAATAGLSVGEEIAANMIVANSGIKGSQAGTGMRSGLLTLAGANKKAQEALEEVGMSSSDAQKQMAEAQETFNALGVTGSNFSQRVMQLGEAFSHMSGDEKLNAAYKIFGKNAATFWTKLLSDPQSLMDFAKYSQEIDSGYATGWASDTAAVMRDNTKTSIEYLKSALDTLQGNAGDALLPAIRSAAEIFSPLVSSAAEWVAQHPQIVQACAAIAAAVSAATVAIAGFSLVMAGVRFAQAGFATAGLLFTDLAAKVTAASTVLRGLTLANIGASLSGGLAAASAAAQAFGTAMLGAARAALTFVFTPVGAALMALALAAYYAYTHWEQLSPAISQVASTIGGLFGPVSALGSSLSASFSGLTSLFAPLSGLVGSLASAIGGGLCGAFLMLAGIVGTVVATVVNLFSDMVKTVTDAVNNIIQIFDALANKDFSAAFKGLKNLGSDFIGDLANIGSNSVNTVAQGFTGTSAALDMMINPQMQAADQSVQTANGVGAIQAQLQQPPVDVAPVEQFSQSIAQANLPAQDFGNSMMMTTPPMQELSMTTPMVSAEMMNVGNSSTMAAPQIDSVGVSSTGAAPQIDSVGTSSANATGGIQALGGVAMSACVGIAALSGSASAVASALSSVAAQISSINISVPQISFFPMSVGGAPVGQNAAGGIYPKGEFLTTFAEDSPEAAIPLDGSSRAISLWQQAGQILGVLPDDNKKSSPLASFNDNSFPSSNPTSAQFYSDSSPIINITVNISGNADESTVRNGIEQSLPRAKSFAEEMAAYRHEQRRRSFA